MDYNYAPYSINFKIIGKRIREARIMRNLSQADLAELTDMSVPFICNIEHAKKQASLESVVKISNSLGITVDTLLSGNLTHSTADYHNELCRLIDDCNNYEKRVIYEIACSVKKTLRENESMIPKEEEMYY